MFDGKNGLEFSDDLFNKLSKGSSYFIPEVLKSSEKFVGTNFSVNIKLDKPEQAESAVKLLTGNGAQAVAKDTQLTISGDLGKLLGGILKDSEEMYHNDGSKVAGRYGLQEMDAMALWWSMLTKMNKEFQKEKEAHRVGNGHEGHAEEPSSLPTTTMGCSRKRFPAKPSP